MRIAFFVNAFPVMSEAFIASAAVALQKAGHEVDIFGLGNARPSARASQLVLSNNLQARTQNAAWPSAFSRRLLDMPKLALDVMDKHGPAHTPLFRPRTYRRSWRDLTAMYQAQILPENGAYDILHCQFATLAEFVLKHRDAGLLSGKLLVNLRGYDITEVVQSHGPHVYDRVWAEGDHFIANCAYFRDRAVEIGCPEDRIEVIGSGIRLSDFPYRPPLAIEDRELRLVSIGRLIERKGFHHALRTIKALKDDGYTVRYDIVGDGPERDSLEAICQQLGVTGNVTLHGARPHEEIKPLLERAHILLAPCMTSATGGVDAPVNSIKEAMASGVMVVSTYHGGIPELVQDGVTGVLASEDDAEDLTRATFRLLELAPGWTAIAERARQRVKAMFDIDRVTGQLLSTYARLTDESDVAVSENAPHWREPHAEFQTGH